MISSEVKASMKKQARRDVFKGFLWVAFIVSVFGSLGNVEPINGESVKVYDSFEDTVLFLKNFSIWIFCTGFISWIFSLGNASKKLYLKRAQKYLLELVKDTRDPIEIQKISVAMSYYGNSMNEVQMSEVKAAAASNSHSHTHTHTYEYRD